MHERKLRVGDKVKIEGHIVDTQDSYRPYLVKLGSLDCYWAMTEDVERIPDPDAAVFKVGDKVRVVSAAEELDQEHVGRTGIIVEHAPDDSELPYLADFNDDHIWLFWDTRLELVEEEVEPVQPKQTEPQWRVGDRVKLVSANEEDSLDQEFVGRAGAITKISKSHDTDDLTRLVEFDGECAVWVRDSTVLELIEAAPPVQRERINIAFSVESMLVGFGGEA
jgi:transcription antitermination factor NusG